jgi:hypothetical protein
VVNKKESVNLTILASPTVHIWQIECSSNAPVAKKEQDEQQAGEEEEVQAMLQLRTKKFKPKMVKGMLLRDLNRN